MTVVGSGRAWASLRFPRACPPGKERKQSASGVTAARLCPRVRPGAGSLDSVLTTLEVFTPNHHPALPVLNAGFLQQAQAPGCNTEDRQVGRTGTQSTQHPLMGVQTACS